MPKLFIITGLLELVGIIIAIIFTTFKLLSNNSKYAWVLALTGIVFFFIKYAKYRNKGARHHHETETKKEIRNLRKVDKLIRRKTGLSNSRMSGANNTSVSGNINKSIIDSITNQL